MEGETSPTAPSGVSSGIRPCGIRQNILSYNHANNIVLIAAFAKLRNRNG